MTGVATLTVSGAVVGRLQSFSVTTQKGVLLMYGDGVQMVEPGGAVTLSCRDGRWAVYSGAAEKRERRRAQWKDEQSRYGRKR